MQGSFEEEPKSDLIKFIKTQYENRKQTNELFTKFTIPESIDTSYKRANENIMNFSFYYMSLSALFFLFFLFTNYLFIVPLAISYGCYYLSKQNIKIGEFEITSKAIFYGCIAINALIFVIFHSIAKCYFSLIIFSSICISIILGHACCLESVNMESEI